MLNVRTMMSFVCLFNVVYLVHLVEGFMLMRRASENRKTALFADNKAMAFLRARGKVGGNRDFTHAIGIDEGPSTKSDGGGKVRTRCTALCLVFP